jgi:hypothetical protein
MPGNSRIRGSLDIARDRQGESGQHGSFRCGIARSGNRVGWAPAGRLLKCSSTPDLVRSEGNADSFLYLTSFLPFAPFIVTHCSLGYLRWSAWGLLLRLIDS